MGAEVEKASGDSFFSPKFDYEVEKCVTGWQWIEECVCVCVFMCGCVCYIFFLKTSDTCTNTD